MPELDYITIRGFKSIASIEKLPLRAINVVIGPNGSGKSNFLEVFSFVKAVREERLHPFVAERGGAHKLGHFRHGGNIFVRLEWERQKFRYEIDATPISGDALMATEGFAGESFESIRDKKLPEWEDAIARLPYWKLPVFHLSNTSRTSPLKQTCDLNDNRSLRADGSNLAAFLYLLRIKHESSYRLIQRTVQRVTPFFDAFLLEPSLLNRDKIKLEWRHKESDQYFDAASLSDGTLRFIALATLFLQPEELRPSVILVDEPELGLHPYAINILASLVKMASEQTQVIVSTQSPQLLDNFEPEDVLVANRVDGGTTLERLDSAKLSGWLEDYSLGQLWEKNEIGGRP